MEDRSKVGQIMRDYHQVKLDETDCLSPHCTIVGDVKLGPNCSVFAGAQLRGDGAPIRIGAETNIQENCCFHVSGGKPLTLGNRVTVGHGAILHGCTIEDNVLVGMGAIVMDDAYIESNCLIAAGALVTQGKRFPAGSLIMGSPAHAVRELSAEEIEFQITQAAPDYRTVGEAMLADGLMVHPPADATIWPCSL